MHDKYDKRLLPDIEVGIKYKSDTTNEHNSKELDIMKYNYIQYSITPYTNVY